MAVQTVANPSCAGGCLIRTTADEGGETVFPLAANKVRWERIRMHSPFIALLESIAHLAWHNMRASSCMVPHACSNMHATAVVAT